MLDAGTGLRSLTGMLDGAAFDGSIVLSHLHWDHMQGLPFFAAGDRDASRVDLYLPAQDGRSGRDLLAQAFSPPAFPITPEGLKGRWTVHALEPGRAAARGIRRGGGRGGAQGRPHLRLPGRGRERLGAYLPDHAPAAGMSDELLAALDGVDVLLHDAQFLERERGVADDYGHATVEDCIRLAPTPVPAASCCSTTRRRARTTRWTSSPRWAAGLAGDLPVVVAREGMAVDVGVGSAVTARLAASTVAAEVVSATASATLARVAARSGGDPPD